MTAPTARPAPRTPQRPFGQWPIGERSLLTSVLGIPPLAAVGLAFGFTALGVFVDLQRIGTVGAVFQVLYFSGCVLAMTWVRRRNLFAPFVQPPLLLAVAVPAIALLGSGTGTGDAGQTLLAVGAPLVNSFPTMAVTTAVVLALGVVRIVVQREKRERRDDDGRPARRVSSGRDSASARGAARRPATPRRS
ncbi:MAG: hypothetical protein QOK35_2421 [Pseudonocardiales bacterium]|nr:hypothetical protein [Pseudonocardiales bacterium]